MFSWRARKWILQGTLFIFFLGWKKIKSLFKNIKFIQIWNFYSSEFCSFFKISSLILISKLLLFYDIIILYLYLWRLKNLILLFYISFLKLIIEKIFVDQLNLYNINWLMSVCFSICVLKEYSFNFDSNICGMKLFFII